MRAAIYARVSTSNGQDPSVQTRELREYCQRRGWSAIPFVLKSPFANSADLPFGMLRLFQSGAAKWRAKYTI